VKHFAAPQFGEAFNALDREAQEAARNAFELMGRNPRHPSVVLKKAGRFGLRELDAAIAQLGLDWSGRSV